jgi:hypothetical protein
MDSSVAAAMARWPDVPACYGWLALDRRGRWRMRDEHVQQHGLLGDVIRHAALKSFIDRNYLSDESGAWYFQNGPQRVFVDLEAAPFIFMFDGSGEILVTHHGHAIEQVDAALVDESGNFYLASSAGFGLICDRDLATLVGSLRTLEGHSPGPDDMLERIAHAPETLRLTVPLANTSMTLALQSVRSETLATRYGYIHKPRGTEASKRLV